MADDQRGAGAGAETCTPCRGTGRLISGLGGTPHQVTCPWCRGTGTRIRGIDAQQAPAEGGSGAGAQGNGHTQGEPTAGETAGGGGASVQ